MQTATNPTDPQTNDIKASNDAVMGRRMTTTKDVLSNKINELQTLVATRQLEGLSDEEAVALKRDVDKLNDHLKPLGRKLADLGTEAQPAQRLSKRTGDEGLPYLTEQQRKARADAVNGVATSDNDEEEEVEEDDGEGNKRTVRRKKAQAKRR